MATFAISDRSFIGDIADIGDIKSLDDENSRRQFRGLPKMKLTLEDALVGARIPPDKLKDILDDAMDFAGQAMEDPNIAGLGLTPGEAGAISYYTLEKEDYSLYKLINGCLAVSRSRGALSSMRKLIYLLLSGLRKLPRFLPSRGQVFYRGIKERVPRREADANGHQYYAEGRTVTWWCFISTTTKFSKAKEFIKDPKKSTIFNIGGADLWGYNIEAFSQFQDEEEILIEPEAKFFVESILDEGILVINVSLQKIPLVLEDIIPVRNSSGTAVVPKRLMWDCAWKECPKEVYWKRKYSVDEKSPRIATKGSDSGNHSTVIGNTPLPLDTVTSWGIRILKSADIYVGVAPLGVDQDKDENHFKCGWYFGCYASKLFSGLPHGCWNKPYGPRKEDGKYVHTGGTVGVVMDPTKGELSFVLNGVNLGVAYEGIPLDEPLVPCVILCWKDDSVELVI